MYHIAICDDNQEFCQALKNDLLEYAKQKNISIYVQQFFTPEEYITYLNENEPVDILFLDIELGKINGVTIGKEIRKDLKNEVTQIVYVSSKESYAMELFQVRPMDFLIKPVKRENVEKIMETYRRLYDRQSKYFIYQAEKQQHRIMEESIFYFRSEGRKVVIVTALGEKSFYGKLSKIAAQLNEEKFCVVHKSYIINMNHVSEYHRDEVIMVNGDRVPISQSMRESVKKKILERDIARREW